MLLFLCFAFLAVLSAVLMIFSAGISPLPAVLLSLAVFVLLHIVYLLFFWLISLRTPMDKPIEKQSAPCRFACMTVISLINFYAGLRVRLCGTELLPTEQRFLLVSNHRSFFDPLIVMDKLGRYNISFVSKPSNLKIPIAGRIAYAAGFLAIDRENDRNALRTILAAADYLKRGICNMGIYPEGTRSKTDEMLPFHAGSLKIAQKAKVPVVVSAVHGTEKINRFRLFSGIPVQMNILEVIPAETVCAMKTTELSDRIRAVIQADLDRNKAGSSGQQPEERLPENGSTAEAPAKAEEEVRQA